MGYAPSKNFIALVSATLVILFVGFFITRVVLPEKKAKKERLASALNAIQKPEAGFLEAYEDANRDTDGDGLKDWEEILWKSDPHKPDTDEDGTTDKEETKENRSPVVAGKKNSDGSWSDAVKSAEVPEKTSTSTPKTLTERIARQFAVEYLTTEGVAGGNINNFQKESITESLVESLSKDALLYKDKYATKDIKILDGASPDTKKEYLNKIGETLKKNLKGTERSEMEILNEAISMGKYDSLSKLDDYISAYKKSLEFLKNLNSPKEYAYFHLELMNILENTINADNFIKTTSSDPARGLVGLYIYSNQISRLANFYKSIERQIRIDNLSFKPNDGGYYFANSGL
ncbi:hypothetical protein HYS99_00595 [Candidatus Giovannonibacteria bacterium]|nr:hypothetical protein [Candidatus Giovannonibacteria bacterium]